MISMIFFNHCRYNLLKLSVLILNRMADAKLPKEILIQLREMEGNAVCVDCSARAPQWASVSYGSFMCLECSGQHRGESTSRYQYLCD